MKTNNKTKVKKVSLLRDVFSFDPFSKSSEKIEKDEMIVHERNKTAFTGFLSLSVLIVIYAIFSSFFDLKYISDSLYLILSIVNYGMLIIFCKKGIVKHTLAWTGLIFGILTLPGFSTMLILKPFEEHKYYAIFMIILIIIFAILLYQIANTIYKKSITSDGEIDEK